MTDATSWAAIEFGHADLGDPRRTRRLVQLAAQRAAQPHASIAQACAGRAATKAAYRFYENPNIQAAAILPSHIEATRVRLAAEPVVLAVQDTTQLDYSAHPATTGLGVLGDANHHGVLVHSTLAVTPQRVPLGLLDQQVWIRAGEELGKRHQRKARPVQDKESQKWVRSLEATARLQAQLPHTLVVNVADREGDVYDFLQQAQELQQAVLVRAAWDRCVQGPDGQLAHLWATLEHQPLAGTVAVTVPRQHGQASRQATLEVRFAPVTVRPPSHRSHEALPLLALWAVLAQEVQAPVGVAPICWRLLTTVPVASFTAACERVQWYSCRWLIEVWHKVLKSGCRVEERQFEDIATIQRYLPLDSVVAWRVLYLTMLGRDGPELPCSVLLEAHEWQALYCFIHHCATPPAQPPPLGEATRWIGQLGGFLGRRGDGAPGVEVLWRGLQRLHDLAQAWQVFGPRSQSP